MSPARSRSPSGYSGTPLVRKLGIKTGMRLVALNAPPGYAALLGDLPDGASIGRKSRSPVAAVHLFVTARARLDDELRRLRGTLEQDGFVWVSWPKRASKIPTDVTEDVIREVALPLGFVDIKVCAVDETWSGLKLVIRRSERTR